jgi:hypothetical protein
MHLPLQSLTFREDREACFMDAEADMDQLIKCGCSAFCHRLQF